MKWYTDIKVVMGVVLAGGLACLFLGIFWGKSLERKKCIKALSCIESRPDSPTSVTIEVDTLLLDRWQLEVMPTQVIMPQIRIQYKIKLREENGEILK